MQVLWDRPAATVGEVVERIAPAERPAYNSVLTILRILERKGYVSHEKEGRAFVYSPVVDRQQARRGALGSLLTRFFGGSRELLVMDLLGHEHVGAAELQQVKALIEAAEQRERSAAPLTADRAVPAGDRAAVTASEVDTTPSRRPTRRSSRP